MTSKAERRRRKRTITLPGGEEAPQRATNGNRAPRETPEDATGVASQARLRILGIPDSPEARRASLAPPMGCAVGRMIWATVPDLTAAERRRGDRDRRADLWQAVMHMRGVWTAYNLAIGAPPRHAQGSHILAPTEAMTTESAPVDDRTPEERARAAVSAWMRLHGWLGHVDAAAQSATIIAVVDETGITNWPGILRALECVSEGVRGETVKVRMGMAPM